MHIVFSLLWALFLFAPTRVGARERAGLAVDPTAIEAKIKEVEGASGLDEDTRAKLLDTYRKALALLEKAANDKRAAEAYRQARHNAPGEAAALRKKIEQQTASPAAPAVAADAELPAIEQALAKEQAELAALEAKSAELEERLAAEASRPSVVRERIAQARQEQEQVTAEAKLPAAIEGNVPLGQAQRLLLQARSRALAEEIHMLDEELLSQPVRVELLQAQRDAEALNVERTSARVKQLQELLIERRRAETDQVVADAEAAMREAEGKHPLLLALAEKNAALTEEIASVTAKLEKVTADTDTASKEAKRIAEEFRATRQKLEIAGLSQALGMVLLEQRRSLPDPRGLRQEAREREREIAMVGLWQIRNEEERGRLRKLTEYLAALLAEVSAEDAERLRPELAELARTRRRLLDQALASERDYLRALGELDFAQRQLIESVEDYHNYLAQRLLWIRNVSPPSVAELRTLPQQIAWLLAPSAWVRTGTILASQAPRFPLPLLLAACSVVLLWKRRSLRDALAATAATVGKPTQDRFASTLKGLALSLADAAPWPLLLGALGWQLQSAAVATGLSKGVAAGLLWVAPPLFYLRVFHALCDTGGLAASHFGWTDSIRRPLRQEIDRFTVLFLPPAFVAMVLVHSEQVTVIGGLLRLVLIASVIAVARFAYGLFEPSRGVLRPVIARDPTSVPARFRPLWLPLAMTPCVILVGLAVAGYLYPVAALLRCLVETTWYMFGLIFLHQLALRWLTLTRRRLAYQALRDRRREASRDESGTKDAHESGGEAASLHMSAGEVDLSALSAETQRLLNAAVLFAAVIGLWFIWREVLPALGVLDSVTLWHHRATVAGEEKIVPVSLADLGRAAVIAVVTVIATRHLPAFLEIVLLGRLDVTAANRYTIKALSRYLTAAAGGLLAFKTIGFQWSQIQWLVAALGVGIGFGLQEIVANFISGLIILFERPIRVGDVVTVGDIDGVVTRIRIRATTIRTWERKELLVPNKEFITSRLLNWSLSDQITRLTVSVGVAYGTDVQTAMSLLAAAAAENTQVLKDPPPFVTFEGFGDNALTLLLRCYVGSLDDRLPTLSKLHEAINRKLNEAGIVIAFPQRDVHLDTSRPLDVRIRPHDEQ